MKFAKKKASTLIIFTILFTLVIIALSPYFLYFYGLSVVGKNPDFNNYKHLNGEQSERYWEQYGKKTDKNQYFTPWVFVISSYCGTKYPRDHSCNRKYQKLNISSHIAKTHVKENTNNLRNITWHISTAAYTLWIYNHWSPAQIVEAVTELERRSTEVSFYAFWGIETFGTERDFSSPKYHNQSPDVFIQSQDPRIVHIRKRGVTWGNFLNTLPMKLTKECLVTETKQTFCSTKDKKLDIRLNGFSDPNALDKKIMPEDYLWVSYTYAKTGPEN
ncbi:MAG: hypothetical protein AAB546_00715 [Patescibacteria group bacterium]